MMMMSNNNNYYYYCNYNNEDDDEDDDTRQVVKLGKEKLLQCLTCPLCLNLFSDATTISECLHTFCRQCIYDKIEDEDLDCCPVCNTDLGGAPLDKLRADHNLQDLRTKLFPPELEKHKAEPEPAPMVPSPAKQKERSLSSLVVNSPKPSPQPSMNGRSKYPTSKSLVVPRQPAPPPEEASKKVEDSPKAFSSQEILTKGVSVNEKQKIQNSTTNESPKQQVPSNAVEDNVLADLLKPPNLIVEATIERTKANNDSEKQREAVVEPVSLNGPSIRDQEHEAEAKVRRRSKRSRVLGDGNESTPSQSGPVTRRKMQRRRERRETVVRQGNSSNSTVVAQNMGDADSKFAGKCNPIWFSLIASNHQEGNEPLPQISSCYLRVKDGSLTVSLVKKYLVKKLDLASDAEVEITLRGQPLISTLRLHNLVDLWIRTSSASEVIQPSAGSSGKDVVLVLSYGRKARPSHRHGKLL